MLPLIGRLRECELRAAAREMGFAHVEAGPLVRSSYHASGLARPAPQGENAHEG